MLGHELDDKLTNDSLEDLLRYRFGAKKPSPSKRWGARTLSAKATNAGQLTGVRLEITADEPDQVGTLPQVGFPDKQSGQRVFFTLAELRGGELKNHPNLDLTQALFWGKSEDVVRPIITELASLGITYKRFERVDPKEIAPQVGELTAEIEFLVSPAIRRAAAKIAFNYFAYIHGATVAAWTYFDTVRRFVRFGEYPGFPVVVEDFKPILYDDTSYSRQTNGHLVTVNWTVTGRDIVAQVSLFNHLTYRVSLARDCQFWWPISSGHLFDVRRRRITKMGSARPVQRDAVG